eukprot:gnl/TRDRNA2_/TRDRNA2_132651_c1_seq1.p1 gnl/TRDRNA2_/TRDRNA2_132651_c1~~gnl/TRDRNA2_/TRDRNA2_132651_c1_seq1.p1  ORF type:complete len:109 (+),score=8.06 gnl/TRDRNA2_/TRDRNA2_132651_c1_seq1:130-456(+)
MSGEPTPTIFDPISVLDRGARTKQVDYEMSMQCLAVSGQIVAGFALLWRAEAGGIMSQPGGDYYSLFRMLLEACRLLRDHQGASRLQMALDSLGLVGREPVARQSLNR